MKKDNFDLTRFAAELLLKPTALTKAMQPDATEARGYLDFPEGNRCDLCGLKNDNGGCRLLNGKEHENLTWEDEERKHELVGLTEYGYCKEFRFSLQEALITARLLLHVEKKAKADADEIILLQEIRKEKDASC